MMDIGFKKTGGVSGSKLGFYSILLLCIVAAGIGAWGAVKNSAGYKDKIASETAGYDNRTPTGAQTARANTPATSVEDIRATLSLIISENATTVPETTTQTPDNLPFKGEFTLPLGTKIIKDYSAGEMVASKTMGDWRVHNGIDFEGDTSDVVLAVQRGTVKEMYTHELWGNVIEVSHGNGMTVKYCGVKPLDSVKTGDEVTRGQELGTLCEIPCEAADGLHLHLEITVEGTIVDPLDALNRA